MQFQSLWELTEYMMRDKYLVSDTKFEEVLDKRRVYKPGEISETTGLQKQPDGSWAEPKKDNQQTQSIGSDFSDADLHIEPSKRDPATIKTATKEQIGSLKNHSVIVKVSSIDTEAIKIVDKTVDSMIKEYGMNALLYINTYNKLGGAMGKSNGYGISLNEDFYNDPQRYYDARVDAQVFALERYNEALGLTPLPGKEKQYETLCNALRIDTVRMNVLYKGKEIESVTLHEMAHVLAHQKINMLFKVIPDRMKKINEYVENVYNKAIENGDVNKISRYARKDYKEFFAEAFVVYKMGIDKLPDYIADMIEKVIK